jgi:hypothetical protein
LPSFCSGVCVLCSPRIWLGLGLKCNEFLALASNELALLPTPLLLRFFSPLLLFSPGALPGLTPLRFSPLGVSSDDFDGVGSVSVEEGFEEDGVSEVDPGDIVPIVGLLESASPSLIGVPELPNILLSNPPWEEKLLRLLPASLLSSLLRAVG